MNHKTKTNLKEITGQVTGQGQYIFQSSNQNSKQNQAMGGAGGKIHVSQTTSVFGVESDWLKKQNLRSDWLALVAQILPTHF